MRQDAWVVVLGRGWSPDVSGRVEAAWVPTHVESAMRQDAWVGAYDAAGHLTCLVAWKQRGS